MQEFDAGSFDNELIELTRSRPETFEWEMLSCLRAAVSVGHAELTRESEGRERAAANVLVESTYEDVKAQAEGDCARLELFHDKRVQWQHDAAKIEARFIADLRNDGSAAAEAFANAVVFFTPHLTKGWQTD